MTRRWQSWCLFLVLGAVVAPGPFAAPTPEELDYARKKIGVYRSYPEEMARLRQTANLFDGLSPERQGQLRQLDADLHQLSSSGQARLQDTLDRYNEWLRGLDEKDRERVLRAPDKAARLDVIRQLRQEEWIRQQPKAFRDELEKREGDDRKSFLDRGRRNQRRRHDEWAIARRFWDDLAKNRPLPTKLEDFDLRVQRYVKEVLEKLLSDEERQRLTRAEGRWPRYPQTLVALADKHPPALPSPSAPRTFADLPKGVQSSFTKKGFKATQLKIKQFEGRFPDFAMQLTNHAAAAPVTLPDEWWVYNYNGLSKGMQDFVTEQLVPILDRTQVRMLVVLENKWPEYPETIQKLADAHNLQVPWFTLPDSREKWDAYRSGKPPTVQGYPELPRYKLRDFVLCDLDDVDRIKFKNEVERTRPTGDREAWAYLVKLYFQHYPPELTRLRALDRAKAGLDGP